MYSAVGEFFELLMAGVVEREGNLIAERIEAARLELFAKGKHATKAQYGYRRNEKGSEQPFSRNEDELRIVRKAFDKLLTTDYSDKGLNQLRKELIEEENLPDKKWTTQFVERILRHPLYIGQHVMQFSNVPQKNVYENLTVIDTEEWLEAQRRLDNIVDHKKRSDKPAHRFYLENLIYCNKCFQDLKGFVRQKNGEKVGTYECTKHMFRINKHELEQLVFARALDTFKQMLKTNMKYLLSRYTKSEQEKLQALMKKQDTVIAEINKKMHKRIKQYMHETNQIKRQTIREKIDRVKADLDAERAMRDEFLFRHRELDENLSKPERFLKQIKHVDNMLKNRDDEELITLLHDIIQGIAADQYGLQITFKHPFLTSAEVFSSVN